MPAFRQTTIKRKLIALIMLTSSVALLVAFALMIVSDYVSFRSGMVRDLRTLADVMGTSGSSALDFDDEEFATKRLSRRWLPPRTSPLRLFTPRTEKSSRAIFAISSPSRLQISPAPTDTHSKTLISLFFIRAT